MGLSAIRSGEGKTKAPAALQERAGIARREGGGSSGIFKLGVSRGLQVAQLTKAVSQSAFAVKGPQSSVITTTSAPLISPGAWERSPSFSRGNECGGGVNSAGPASSPAWNACGRRGGLRTGD